MLSSTLPPPAQLSQQVRDELISHTRAYFQSVAAKEDVEAVIHACAVFELHNRHALQLVSLPEAADSAAFIKGNLHVIPRELHAHGLALWMRKRQRDQNGDLSFMRSIAKYLNLHI